MYITIYCGGMPFDGETIKNKSLGGSESAAYYMAQELSEMGHKVTLFTAIEKESETNGVRYLPMGIPSEANPLGDTFHYYAMNTPTDVMIIQRHPKAFLFKWASKINLWWLHDLTTKSYEPMVLTQMYNVQGVLCVSEWHKRQIIEVWDIDPEFIFPIQNGVDLSLYEANNGHEVRCHEIFRPLNLNGEEIKLLYSSRPERGLENLVYPKGIMAKIYETNPEYHLYVCAYDNVVEQMVGYYSWLYEQCEKLPNVTVLGNLTKQELADVQRQCDLCIYPTAFEETSCITAMECAAAGLPMLTSRAGAIPETTRKSDNVTLINLIKDDIDYRGMELRVAGKVYINAFVLKLKNKTYHLKNQSSSADQFAWSVSADMLQGYVADLFDKKTIPALAKHYMQNSDIYALKDLIRKNATKCNGDIMHSIWDELIECYSFIMKKDGWTKHYEEYYQYEKERGVEYGPENLDGQSRFELVSDHIANLPAGSSILDYGCAHGHFTINLAKRFPERHFIGVDLVQSNVEIARKWAAEEKLTNVKFYVGSIKGEYLDTGVSPGTRQLEDCDALDLIIVAEVLEHLESPAECIDALAPWLKDTGKFYITTPYGPWEAEGYIEHWPWRAHVHHLERADIYDLFGMHKGLSIQVAPAGIGKKGKAMGSYIYMIDKPTKPSGKINYERKHKLQMPRETLSLCLVMTNGALDIGSCLNSVNGVVDEIIIGLDKDTEDDTDRIIRSLGAYIPTRIFDIEPCLKQGFDSARNETIKKASCDWILWMDADEVLHNPQNLQRYLCRSQFKGYAIQQHHFTQEPMGIMKVDRPTRIFRNNEDIIFRGIVHEHPEKTINKGVGRAINIVDVEIAHYGYVNGKVRYKRFERNIGLMVRDREAYPDRHLGKFLWLRDLSQMCGFELQRNGARITKEMLDRAKRGIAIFEELLTKDTIPMAIDGLEFYSRLVSLTGKGIEFNAEIESQRVQGQFQNVRHFEKLVDLIIKEKAKRYERSKYM